MNLPLKTDIFAYAVENSPFTIDELMKDLDKTHGKERQFKTKLIEKYIMAYCGVKVIVPDEAASGSVLQFTVSEYGKQNIAYIKPKAV